MGTQSRTYLTSNQVLVICDPVTSVSLWTESGYSEGASS
jgi:hypothetical protein